MENNEDRINKIRNRINKLTNTLKDYVPEISGAAIGAAFGNPVVGAVIGTAAKRLLDKFLEAKKKPMDFSQNIKDNIERFGNATIVATGNAKKRETQDTYTLSKEGNGFTTTTPLPTTAYFAVNSTFDRR